MGKLIDAEFGGKGAHDRWCAGCHERFPRGSTLCPRCGGALLLWATHAAADQRKQRRERWIAIGGLVLAGVIALVAALLR